MTVYRSRGIFALAVVWKIPFPQFTPIMKIQTLTTVVVGMILALAAQGNAQKLNDVQSFNRQFQHAAFVENKGQWNSTAGFLSQFPGMNVWVTPSGFVMDVNTPYSQNVQPRDKSTRKTISSGGSIGQVVSMEFTGAQSAKMRGETVTAGVNNYLIGIDPTKWKQNVRGYTSLVMEELYPGINTKCYERNGTFRYDLICAPKSDISLIRLLVTGANGLILSESGDVNIQTQLGDLIMGKPVAYQVINHKTITVECQFRVTESSIGFNVGTYNKDYELIIDPPVFSTLLGGNLDDVAKAITVDTNKSAYITGETNSVNFPTTTGAYKTSSRSKDSFVSKFTPSGTGLVYSTYIGGDNGSDNSTGITVDDLGHAYITGFSSSKDFPTTDGSVVKNLDAGSDAFVLKLKPDGTGFIYSTLIGGRNDDFGNSIVINKIGEAVFCGYTAIINSKSDFPITTGAFQTIAAGGALDGFVTKLDPSGKILSSTLLGGDGDDYVRAVTMDVTGAVYCTGETISQNLTFPTSPQAIQRAHQGSFDCFVSKFTKRLDTLAYSTILGGQGDKTGDDRGTSIAVDIGGFAYVTGFTSSPKFITTATPLAYDTTFNGNYDAFVLKLNLDGSRLEYSTFIGGAGYDEGNGIAIDACGAAYITGRTYSPTYPVTSNAIDTNYHSFGTDTSDSFITKFNSTGSIVTYSTFIGGRENDYATAIFVDSTGATYITGQTNSANFPSTAGNAFAGGQDAFLTKVQVGILPLSPRIIADGPLSFCGGGQVTLEAEDKFYKTYQWFRNDSLIPGAVIPRITAIDSGLYRLDVTDLSGCIGIGSMHVRVRPVPSLEAGKDIVICPDSTAQIQIKTSDSIRSYKWVPLTGLSSDTVANPTAKPPTTITYYVTITDTNGCTNSDSVTVIVLDTKSITLVPPSDTIIICPLDSVSAQLTITNSAIIPQKLRISVSDTNFRILTDTTDVAATDSVTLSVNFKGQVKDSVYSTEITVLDLCGTPHTSTVSVRVGRPLITFSTPSDTTICQQDSATSHLTLHNNSAVTATLAFSGGGGKFTVTPSTAVIKGGDSAIVAMNFAGNTGGLYSSTLRLSDQCGKQDSANFRFIVQAIPLKILLSSPAQDTARAGVTRIVNVEIDSINVLNNSSNKQVTFTLEHEQTTLEFDTVLAGQCTFTQQKSAGKTVISLANCTPLLQNPLAQVRYKTVVGTTLSPVVRLTNVTVGNKCIAPTASGSDTIRLLAYGCEITTLNVQLFTSALRSVFPNPLSQSATIEYATVEQTSVKITILNSLGQVVRTVLNTPHNPGVYQATFMSDGLPQGVYFLVLEAGTLREAKSMMIE
ncbi:MAG: SBBP repeat-containing protein [Ignavibacteria bacterium]|nr:SBBP repeat-containing protein [Ignavibacteria bacterium]